MDKNQAMSDAFRTVRKLLQQSQAQQFAHTPPGFEETARSTVNLFSSLADQADDYYAAMAAEVIPRLFVIDVATGYRFFHQRDMLLKLWDIYNRSAAIVAAAVGVERRIAHSRPPYKVACITSIFSDYLAPAKALANFALSLDREKFQPVMIITNQPGTMERRGGFQVIPYHTTKTGAQLLDQGIDIIGMPIQDNVVTLAKYLIEVCSQLEIDMVVTNASMFSFPEACLARSGVATTFFDMHRGFPLYVDGIDAILHFVAATREQQLGPWLERGGKVIDYRDGIAVPPLPSPMPPRDPGKTIFITASNYLEQRLSPEFCSVVERLLRDCPGSVYRLVGACDRHQIIIRFPANLRRRLEFVGAVTGTEAMMKEFFHADVYLNEFPVSGVRVCLEAMCAALPVVTMKGGHLHVNVTAAEHVGDFAIQEYAPEKYYHLARSLATNPDRRREVGMALRQRMEKLYDLRLSFAALSQQLLAIHEAKLQRLATEHP